MSKSPLIFMQIPHLILNYPQFSYFRYFIRWQIAHGMKLNPFPVPYRSISQLPILTKVFEKLFITQIQPILQSTQIIPDHQFGFRRKHSTIDKVHRITNIIHRALENKQYCTAAFLDISQAFDKVWHEGLLCKRNTFLPDNMYRIIQSYLAPCE